MSTRTPIENALGPEGFAFWLRAQAWIERGADARAEASARDAFGAELFAWQRRRCAALDAVARAFGGGRTLTTLRDIPGVPTDVWKAARVACFDPTQTTRTFRTSGTTQDVRGQHAFADTDLYARACRATATTALLPRERYACVFLAPDERDAPDSSLSFMLARFAERWHLPHAPRPWMVRHDEIDAASVRTAIDGACESGTPVALLGASWAFVHLIDALGNDARWHLPEGSVVMPTGGFKGRSRTLEPRALFDAIAARWGVARKQIVQEYGMTELSSQAYERPDLSRPPGRYVSPTWMHVCAVDPESLAPLPHGERGLLKIVDLMNVGSCIAVQTSDVGAVFDDGFEVYGRAPDATPRGCARAIDAALSGSESHR